MNSTNKASKIAQALPAWADLFEDFRVLEADRIEKKEQGVNDFNLLGSVLSANDEVRLHTRFLFAMLNPKGKHYRGTQFLELFLKTIGREGWLNLNSEALEIRKEYCPAGQSDQIDLYISDGKRIIVVENKLNALDQPGQVKRYLRAIGADSGELALDTLFIYLTKGRSRPSSNALAYPENKKKSIPPDPTPLQIIDCDGELALCTHDGVKTITWARYQNLSYRSNGSAQKGIHSWLDACEQVVDGIDAATNVSWAIRDYRNVVKRATKEYSSNVKSLKEHFEENGSAGTAHHEKAIQLAQELQQAHAEWLHEAMTDKVNGLLGPELDNGTLIRIGPKNTEELAPFVGPNYSGSSAHLLYSRKSNFFLDRGKPNRGAFFVVKKGNYANRVMLMLFYGRTQLHVGCTVITESEAELHKVTSEFGLTSPTKLRKSIFPHAVTNSKLLERAGIMDLANFDKSQQAEIMRGLAELFARIPQEEGNME